MLADVGDQVPVMKHDLADLASRVEAIMIPLHHFHPRPKVLGK